jgi:hypothetical protein
MISGCAGAAEPDPPREDPFSAVIVRTPEGEIVLHGIAIDVGRTVKWSAVRWEGGNRQEMRFFVSHLVEDMPVHERHTVRDEVGRWCTRDDRFGSCEEADVPLNFGLSFQGWSGPLPALESLFIKRLDERFVGELRGPDAAARFDLVVVPLPDAAPNGLCSDDQALLAPTLCCGVISRCVILDKPLPVEMEPFDPRIVP